MAAIYGQVAGHPFAYMDDGVYIVGNVHVAHGFSWSGIVWAFTAFHAGNWHPLTWLSHMLDAQLFGVTEKGAGGHHLMSVGLHALDAVLLFLAFERMTGLRWPSALIAALFAVHPLRVESVAWASERKDVLSGLFFMLTVLAYARYAERPGIGRYSWVLLAFIAGLLAKPMLVTVPFMLLLLDVWPLRRWRPGWLEDRSSTQGVTRPPTAISSLPSLIREKLPLLALCVISSVATIAAQAKGGAVSELAQLPMAWRLVELPISYSTYLWKTLWPTGLAAFYPHPATVATEGIAAWFPRAALAGLVLLIATGVVWLTRLRRPYLLVGWLWFLGMLVPVIGLLQVGSQAWADRYAYLPLIGIYTMVAFGARDLGARHGRVRMPMTVAACGAIVALAVAAWHQVGYWRDNRTLLEHALLVTRDNWLVHNDLGVAISREGRLEEGRRHFDEALRIQPDYADARSNLAFSLLQQGQVDDARRECERALEIRPDHPEAHFVLGCVLDRLGRYDEARRHFEEALRLRPEYAEAHYRLGLTLQTQGRTEEACRHLEEARRLKPEDLQTQLSLAALLAAWSRASASQRNEALVLARQVAERTQYGMPASLATLAAAWAATGRLDQAVHWQTRALAIAPDPLKPAYRAYLERYRSGQPLVLGR